MSLLEQLQKFVREEHCVVVHPDTELEDAGLDSLDTIELVGEAEELSGKVLPQAKLGEVRTLRQLVAALADPTE